MPRQLTVGTESFPIVGAFTISRGSKTEAAVLTCTLVEGGVTGRGECVPYKRYGETMESVRDAIEAVRAALEAGVGREELRSLMPQGAARNAVDCALWDFEAKRLGRTAWQLALLAQPIPRVTAFTLSMGEPEAMAAQARAQAHRPLLKIKLGGAGDIDRMRAVRDAAPSSQLIVDANEGWDEDMLVANLAAAAKCRVSLVEQPLPAGRDAMLGSVAHPVPVCADESVHGEGDLGELRGLYEAVNIKLDKTGGLTAALRLKSRAEELGLQVMVGCMVGSSLAMAPAMLLAQGADYVDLDGPLLLARDRSPGLRYEGSLVFPPQPELWG